MPGEIISWVTNQALVNLRKLKLYQASFLTLYQESFPKINYREGKKLLKKKNTHTHMEFKQYVTKKPMDHQRNQRENKKHVETHDNKNKITL